MKMMSKRYLAARNSSNNNNLTNHKSCAANAAMDQEQHSSRLVPEEKAKPDTTDLIALRFSKGNQAYGGIPTLPSLPSY